VVTDFWGRDEVNLVAVGLDGRSLGAFAVSCRSIHENLRSVDTLRWLASLRGLEEGAAGISSIKHLEIAETMATCANAIFFDWGSTTVDASAMPSLIKVAKILARHAKLQLSVEAHCGLEARYAMPLPGQAREFTRGRAQAVVTTLVGQARQAGLIRPAGVPLPADAAEEASFTERVHIRAWGCSRPLVWCFGQYGMGEPVDEDGAALNRRVELYLRGDGFEVPRRRRRSEIPRPPGEGRLEDAPDGALDDNDDDGTADTGGSSQLLTVRLPNGEDITLSAAMLHHFLAQMNLADVEEEAGLNVPAAGAEGEEDSQDDETPVVAD